MTIRLHLGAKIPQIEVVAEPPLKIPRIVRTATHDIRTQTDNSFIETLL
jgi:hypothetical protein